MMLIVIITTPSCHSTDNEWLHHCCHLQNKVENIGHLPSVLLPSVLWRCWLGGRKGIRPVKKLEWWGAGVVICLERDADLHMAQLMPLPLTVSCFSKIQIGFTFLVPAHPGSPGKGPLNVCVCAGYFLYFTVGRMMSPSQKLSLSLGWSGPSPNTNGILISLFICAGLMIMTNTDRLRNVMTCRNRPLLALHVAMHSISLGF